MQPTAPPPQVSFDEFVGMSGAAKAWGAERMCGHYRISMETWGAIHGAWHQAMAVDPPRFATFGAMVDQEAARITAGGAPRMVTSLSLQNLERGAAQIGNAIGDAFTSAFDHVSKAIASPGIGSHVLVQWADGQRYPGVVAQLAPGQYLVTMGNGKQHWVSAAYVTLP